MNKKKYLANRVISVLVSLGMCAGLFCTTAFASEEDGVVEETPAPAVQESEVLPVQDGSFLEEAAQQETEEKDVFEEQEEAAQEGILTRCVSGDEEGSLCTCKNFDKTGKHNPECSLYVKPEKPSMSEEPEEIEEEEGTATQIPDPEVPGTDVPDPGSEKAITPEQGKEGRDGVYKFEDEKKDLVLENSVDITGVTEFYIKQATATVIWVLDQARLGENDANKEQIYNAAGVNDPSIKDKDYTVVSGESTFKFIDYFDNGGKDDGKGPYGSTSFTVEGNILTIVGNISHATFVTSSTEKPDPEQPDPENPDPENPGSEDPTPPTTPNDNGGGSGGRRPSQPTNPVTIPEEDVPLAQIPEEEPPVEVEITEPEVPLAQPPEFPETQIAESEVPLAAQPAIPTRPAKSTSSILDEKVPLADVPSTGDVASAWYALTLAAAAGLAALKLTGKRKEQ